MITFRGIRPYYGEAAFLTSARNQLTPEIISETINIPGRPGVLNVSKQHGARTIGLTFELLGHSAQRNAEIAADIAAWAESETEGQFVFDELPDRFYLARLLETSEVDYAEEAPEIELTFMCANPYAFSLKEYEKTTGAPIWYEGTVAVWPKIIFEPKAEVVSPVWTCGDRKIELTGYTAQPGHTITIDNANRLITDDGASIMRYMSIDSDWFCLKRGNNRIDGGGRVVWRNVYL